VRQERVDYLLMKVSLSCIVWILNGQRAVMSGDICFGYGVGWNAGVGRKKVHACGAA
jgi:hypothetical protein